MSRNLVLLFGVVLLAVALVDAGLARRGKHLSGLHRGLYGSAKNFHRHESLVQDGPLEQWFQGQKQDHFDPENNQIWSQRFFLNDTFWSAKHNGPIFMILGGEGPISSSDVVNHFVITQYAQQFKALVISVEHRFYGKSIPTSSTSTGNLRLLSTPQALADYANFQAFITNKFNATQSKWIVFGGSYSGNLAAWYRMKYPHLAHGAIASSAPVQATLDFPQYLVTVGQGLGPACAAVVQNATAAIETNLQSSSGRSNLQQLFKTCGPIQDDPNDLANFMESITDPIAGIVQYNNDNVNYQPFNTTVLCSILQNPTYGSPLQAYAAAVAQINAFNGENCTEASYKTTVNELSISLPVDTAARSWTWQTCTEFGYFQTGESTAQPFSKLITLQYYENICKDVFGPSYLPNIAWTNTYYGSTSIRTTKTIFPNGSVDPWHNLGLLNANTPLETTIFINGTAHCADLYNPRPQDPPGLTAARATEVDAIQRWLEMP